MILFKRVGESLGQIEGREWVLLTLETMGVLAGILIAFELQEWGSRRSSAAKHHELMDRLFEESEQDVAVTREMRDQMRSLGAVEAKFATILNGGGCPEESLWPAVGTVNILPSFAPPRSVFEEMMGTGGMTSIPDRRIRGAIQLFNAQLTFAQGQTEYFRSVQVQPVPLSDSRLRLGFDQESDGLETAQYDRAPLCADRAFRNRMIEAAATHLKVVSYHERVANGAIAMCGALAASLGRSCQPAFGGPLSESDLNTLRAALK